MHSIDPSTYLHTYNGKIPFHGYTGRTKNILTNKREMTGDIDIMVFLEGEMFTEERETMYLFDNPQWSQVETYAPHAWWLYSLSRQSTTSRLQKSWETLAGLTGSLYGARWRMSLIFEEMTTLWTSVRCYLSRTWHWKTDKVFTPAFKRAVLKCRTCTGSQTRKLFVCKFARAIKKMTGLYFILILS